MKVVIPVAGLGSRLKPHTFTTSKALICVAGKPVLEFVLRDVEKLNPDEVILVVGHHKDLIIDFVKKNFPNLNTKFKEQKVLDGDGGALNIALMEFKEDDDLYVIFGADTLIDFDLKKQINRLKNLDAGIFTTRVDEPEHYGVINVDENNFVYLLEEKPKNPKSDLAVIGAYYFKSLLKVKNILNYLYENEINLNGEYKIAQVLNTMINDKKIKVKSIIVDKWFDCGRVEVILEANKYFLKKLSKNKIISKGTCIIIPPCFIEKSAKIDSCVIGPYVSIGKNVELKNSIIKNSIILDNSYLDSAFLDNSLIGKEAEFVGKANKLNLGDKSCIYLN